jgi:FkbM family methyltransferase
MGHAAIAVKLKEFNYCPNSARSQTLLEQMSQQAIANPRRQVDRPLILYGAGNLGRMAKQYFERINIDIDAVVDKHAEKYQEDPFWDGISVIHPNAISSKRRQQVLLAVCVANAYFSILETELFNSGWRDIAHFYDIAEAYNERHPLSNGWFCDELTESDCASIFQVLQHWHDDASRAYHLQFLAWRHLRQDWIFSGAPMMTGNRYLIPEIRSVLHKRESFVDVGGHHGETSLLFLKAVNFEFNQLWIFEPDANNLRCLRDTFAFLTVSDRKKIHVLQYALSSHNAKREFFDGAGYASQLSTLGNIDINVISLDTLDIEMSLIKLHVEGAELDVLKGANRVLMTHRPIVAATSYHNRLGLSEMAQWLMDTLFDYIFLYRLHSGCGTGAVIYAIPCERYGRQFAI